MHKLLVKILKRANLLEKVNVNSQIVLNGTKLTIPIDKGIGYSNLDITEPWMSLMLSEILTISKGGFIDVGVNIGQTLLKLRSINREVSYYGFEPNSACVAYSQELARINKFEHTTFFPVGVSDSNQIAQLNLYYDNSTDSSASLIPSFRQGQQVQRVEYVPIFTWKEIENSCKLEEISIVKIDVEGAEVEVLRSLQGVLLDKKPFILIEILPVYNKENDVRLLRQREIENILSKVNYVMYRVIKQDEQFKSLKRIDEIGIHDDLNACEYVCCSKEKVDALEQTRLFNGV